MQIGARRSLHLREYEDRSASQFDVVVRVDLAGPVPIDAVRPGVAAGVDLEVIYEGISLPTCPTCGRTNCPAADPTSGRECDFAGV